MKAITGIHHVGIRVKSLEASRSFYEKLGFRFVEGPIGPEPVAVMDHPSGVCINFILNASEGASENLLMDIPEKHTGYTHMALQVSDLSAVEDHLSAHNVELTGGPITLPNGATFLFTRDPDGNVIEFHHPPQTA